MRMRKKRRGLMIHWVELVTHLSALDHRDEMVMVVGVAGVRMAVVIAGQVDLVTDLLVNQVVVEVDAVVGIGVLVIVVRQMVVVVVGVDNVNE